MQTSRIAAAMLLASGLMSSLPAQAAPRDGHWEFRISPYLLVPHMSGTMGIGDLQANVDVGPEEILSRLQFGLMLSMEANNGTWGLAFDGIYMHLKESGTAGPLSAEAHMKQGAQELIGLRRLTRWGELLVGGRLNILSGELQTEGIQARAKSGSQTWFDPIIGARLQVPNTGSWLLVFRGDVGGFGVGSDLAWQVYPSVGYRFSKLFELNLGYRVLSMDYSKDDPAFLYDMRTFGAELGLAFHF